MNSFHLQVDKVNMNSGDVEKVPPQPAAEKIQVYAIRWLVLGIFVAYSSSNSIQWIQFSIISDVVKNYYNIDTSWVDWTSMIFMVMYIPFVFPASYLLEKFVSEPSSEQFIPNYIRLLQDYRKRALI